MEAVVFVCGMEAAGKAASLPGPMVNSPRRWEERPLRTLLLWAFMQTAFALGAGLHGLASFYKEHDSGGGRPGEDAS